MFVDRRRLFSALKRRVVVCDTYVYVGQEQSAHGRTDIVYPAALTYCMEIVRFMSCPRVHSLCVFDAVSFVVVFLGFTD